MRSGVPWGGGVAHPLRRTVPTSPPHPPPPSPLQHTDAAEVIAKIKDSHRGPSTTELADDGDKHDVDLPENTGGGADAYAFDDL